MHITPFFMQYRQYASGSIPKRVIYSPKKLLLLKRKQPILLLLFAGLEGTNRFAIPVTTNTHKLLIMNKAELIEAIANDSELSKADAGRALDALVDAITKSLKKGESVSLVGFGTYSISKRAARTGRNPQTGAAIKIKASNAVKFKAGSKLSESVN